MRWEVVNYVQLSNPGDPISMYVDHIEYETWDRDDE